jgi:hypothetical protein
MKIEHPSILVPPEMQLEREGSIVVECALAFGKDMSWLYGSAGESNISCWNGVGVENGRITRIDWYDEKVSGSRGRVTENKSPPHQTTLIPSSPPIITVDGQDT